MIRRAEERDIDGVERSYFELLDHEKQHGGFSNWVAGVYPTRSVAEKSCQQGTLYVLWEDGGLCASMILDHRQPEQYAEVDWLYPAAGEELLVLHTLCVPPSKAGQGYGREMVRWAVEQARERGCKAMRLDTWSGNAPAAALYRGFGFRYAGAAKVLFQGLIPEELVFFELPLE